MLIFLQVSSTDGTNRPNSPSSQSAGTRPLAFKPRSSTTRAPDNRLNSDVEKPPLPPLRSLLHVSGTRQGHMRNICAAYANVWACEIASPSGEIHNQHQLDPITATPDSPAVAAAVLR